MDKIGTKLRGLLPKSKQVKILLATLLLTLGVYFSFPEKGLIATFPLMFLFSFGAALVYPRLWFTLVCAGGISFFYGAMAALADPLIYAAVSLLSALTAYFCASSLRNLKAKKKWKCALTFFLCLAVGILLPVFYLGNPASYLSNRDKAEAYLQKTYPDQVFSRLTLYYDVREGEYRGTVSYALEENTLTSELRFGDEVEDGFYEDYSAYVLMKRKSDLIRVFTENGFSVTTEEMGLLCDRTQPIPGKYGTVDEALLDQTHFSVTFRDELPERRDFAEACSQALSALQDAGAEFGRITFYALDAGSYVYACEVSYDTDPETTLSLVTRY